MQFLQQTLSRLGRRFDIRRICIECKYVTDDVCFCRTTFGLLMSLLKLTFFAEWQHLLFPLTIGFPELSLQQSVCIFNIHRRKVTEYLYSSRHIRVMGNCQIWDWFNNFIFSNWNANEVSKKEKGKAQCCSDKKSIP